MRDRLRAHGQGLPPFTLGVLAAMVVCAWATGTIGSRLSPEALVFVALAPSLGHAAAQSLLTARDVGPSAGSFGCVGALIARLTPLRRALAAAGLALFLVAISFWRPDPGFAKTTLWISDLSHPLAALAGFGYVRARRQALG